jgi:hypothetical protein
MITFPKIPTILPEVLRRMLAKFRNAGAGIPLLALAIPSATHASDADVARKWGLLGRWAEDCRRSPSIMDSQNIFSESTNRSGKVDDFFDSGSVLGPFPLTDMQIRPDGRLEIRRPATRLSPAGVINVLEMNAAGRIRTIEVYGVGEAPVTLNRNYWLQQCDNRTS